MPTCCGWSSARYFQNIIEFVCVEKERKNTYLLSCGRTRCRNAIGRYNDVVNIVVKYIEESAGIAKAEPSSVSTGNRDRVNVEIHWGCLHLHIDVRIKHRTSTSHMRVTMQTLSAAIKIEKGKKRKDMKNAEELEETLFHMSFKRLEG